MQSKAKILSQLALFIAPEVKYLKQTDRLTKMFEAYFINKEEGF